MCILGLLLWLSTLLFKMVSLDLELAHLAWLAGLPAPGIILLFFRRSDSTTVHVASFFSAGDPT